MLHGSETIGFWDAAAREWLMVDGAGGWSAGTAALAPARRAHALLVAATATGPFALVSRFEERLALGGATHELSACLLAGGRAREGAFGELESFSSEPWPVWRWRFETACLERSLRPIHGHAAIVATWRLLSGVPARLSVAPLVLAREPFASALERADMRGAVQGIPGRVRIETIPGAPAVMMWHNGTFMPARTWARGLASPLDAAVTGDGEPLEPEPADDAFLPGWVQAGLASPGAALHVVLSSDDGLFRALATEGRLGTPPVRTLNDCVEALERHERARRRAWTRRVTAGADFTARQAATSHGGAGDSQARRVEALVREDDPHVGELAARLADGLVRRHGRLTIVPAWPDGVERGAETLRAAAALVTLREFEPVRAIARGYLDYLDEGLAPEVFDPVSGAPGYGDPEPTLLLVHLVELLARREGGPHGLDAFLCETAWPALEGALHHLRSGARHGVGCDAEGLLWAGEGDRARADAGTNALWYHALVAMAQLGKLLGRRENAAFYLAWARDLQRRYAETFWDERAGCLFEAITPAGRVRGLTPRQLWAVALPPALLPGPLAVRLADTVRRELLVPGGLLERPGDGEPHAEWLGAWSASELRAHGRSQGARARVAAHLERALARLRGHASRPGTNGRTTRSALEAAELLRAWIEDDVRTGPPPAAAGLRIESAVSPLG